MSVLEDEGTNDMDRITQLVRLTQKSLEDLTKLTPLVPIDDDVYPPAETKKDREKVQTLSPEEFEKHKIDLVREFVQRAKEVEILIDVMPSKQDSDSIASIHNPPFTAQQAHLSRLTRQNARIESLEPEMRAANAEYRDALAEAQALHDEYKASLAALLASSSGTRLPSSS